MLRILIEGKEVFDEGTNKFSKTEDVVVDLEHSLDSLSKWESKHQKPFLSSMSEKKVSDLEIFDYLKFMILDPAVDPDVVYSCSQENVEEIQNYIESSQTATTFGKLPEHRGPGETITSELVYYWMIAFNINWEAQHWHLNRLLTLVRICNIKNSKPKKRTRREMAEERARLNAERRQQLGTSG